MTTKPGLAVITAASLAVLSFGNTAHAEQITFLDYAHNYRLVEQKIAAELPKSTPIEQPIMTPLQPIEPAPAPVLEPLPEPESIAAAPEPVVSTRYEYSSNNGYAWGYCTWYAKSKRPDLPNNLGNGGQWVANAANQGFATGSAPRAGAIGEQPGHVVYIESVNADGTVNISEMNYNGGVGVVHTRTVAASMFTYIY